MEYVTFKNSPEVIFYYDTAAKVSIPFAQIRCGTGDIPIPGYERKDVTKISHTCHNYTSLEIDQACRSCQVKEIIKYPS